MGKNYKLVLLILSGIILTSCNARRDYFKIQNVEPITTELDLSFGTGNIDLSSNPITITDTLKRTFSNNYKFKLVLEDEVEYVKVSKRIYEGSGSSKINGQYIDGAVELSASELEVTYSPSSNNLQVIDYTFEDIYGKVTIVRLRLFCFQNIGPVAHFSFNNTQLFDPNEYEIAAGESYDRDARFGGKINEYEFNIGLYYSVTTTSNSINHIFSAAGTYAIKVRVKDNDGVWSDYKTNIIVIN